RVVRRARATPRESRSGGCFFLHSLAAATILSGVVTGPFAPPVLWSFCAMRSPLKGLIERIRPRHYGRRHPLVLINGLAEQAESWYRNQKFWSRYFEVLTPNILAYEGDALHRRIASKQAISVDYLVGQLFTYLDQFVQTPPYHMVSSSLGGKVAVEFAVRYPELVSRLVLLCPSGMGDKEQLPIIEGVVGRDAKAVVKSVFHRPRRADRPRVLYYQARVA